MDAQKVDLFVMTNQKYFPAEKIVYLKDKLLQTNESKINLVTSTELKDPTTILLVSIFLGALGIDRFMLGETGMGILKLLTLGCFGILTIVDWFTVQKKARELNFNKLMVLLQKMQTKWLPSSDRRWEPFLIRRPLTQAANHSTMQENSQDGVRKNDTE